MCVIAYYPEGITPEKSSIEYMMGINRDGAGVGWNDGKRAYMVKGFTDAGRVFNFIVSLRERPSVRDIVFHARIATSGGISAEKCHPYLLTANSSELNYTEATTTKTPLIFHNGIFSLTPDKGLNDTQTFIRRCLYPLQKLDPRGLKWDRYDELIEMATGRSRLLMLYPDEVKRFGEWTADGGALYSNYNFKKPDYSQAFFRYAGGKWYEEYDG